MNRKSSAAEVLTESCEESDDVLPAESDDEQSASESGPEPLAGLPPESEIGLVEIDLEEVDLDGPDEEESAEKEKSPGCKSIKKISLNAVQSYFKQIAENPVLKPGEELELGMDLLKARHERSLLAGDKKGKKDQKRRKDYLAAQKKVEELEDKFVVHNLRLVVSYARRFSNVKGFEFLDLIQEGNIGLRRASRKFDPARGFRFATYAMWWIRQSINRAIRDTGSAIRLPVHICELHSKYLKTVQMLKGRKNFRPDYVPGPDEIAGVMDITADKVRKLENLPQATVSLNNPVSDPDGARFIDITPDEKMPPADDKTLRESDRKYLDDLLGTLTPREQFVMRQRFGLDNKSFREAEGKTLGQIGYVMNVTRERVRQIEAQALEKLRRAVRRLESSKDWRLTKNLKPPRGLRLPKRLETR